MQGRKLTSSALSPSYKATVIPDFLPPTFAAYIFRTPAAPRTRWHCTDPRRRRQLAQSDFSSNRISFLKSISPNGILRKSVPNPQVRGEFSKICKTYSPEGAAGLVWLFVTLVNVPPDTVNFCAPGKKAPAYLDDAP